MTRAKPQPYPLVNDVRSRYEINQWVLVPGGRLGLVRETRYKGEAKWYLVQFGAGGPWDWFLHGDLLLASRAQVAEMDGVG